MSTSSNDESDNEIIDINDEINQFIENQMPVIKDLSEYWTIEGIVALTLGPFTQGLFHGLGEGIARVFVGGLVDLPPYYALGGRFGYEPEKEKMFFLKFFKS